MSRLVVLLCGAPGAGKTTAAHESGLTVYDRDDPQWPDERTFKAGISRLASDPHAQAVVIRCGASSSARAKAAALIGATHVYLVTADQKELARRIVKRARPDARNSLAALKSWAADFDNNDGVEPFPGWSTLGPSGVGPVGTKTTPRVAHSSSDWAW